MPSPDIQGSEYTQQSFSGGMNLLLDDTHLATNQYRIGFNLRNRYDRLDLIKKSKEDVNIPKGVKQEFLTFGVYLIAFVSGEAFYRHYLEVHWHKIAGFSLDKKAKRYWTVAVPVATTNYIRYAAPISSTDDRADARGKISVASVAGASAGNLPGLLVQDNINQPQFIFLDNNGYPVCRTTQDISQWSISFTDDTCTVVLEDKREYVPVGNVMEWCDGVLYIASQDGNYIYPSVSGRPLDFVRNVTNKLSNPQRPGGDASSTAYSVGVGGISVMKAMADGSLFVAAGNATFLVSKDKANNAPLEFGEYIFVRRFLFNASCMSERAIFDTLGDTRFIDLCGIRSFNSIQQLQNEGRNSVFSSTIQSAFEDFDKNIIVQSQLYSAAMLFNNYELYGVTTIFGPVLAVYDTVLGCWVGFDTNQTGGKRIKKFAKIELDVLRCYCLTEDDKLFELWGGTEYDTAEVQTVGVTANMLYAGENIRLPNPRIEVKLDKLRVILNRIVESGWCAATVYVNNRISLKRMPKNILYTESPNPTEGLFAFADADTLLKNLMWATPNCHQGWKVGAIISWNTGAITQFGMELSEQTPQNPLSSQ